MKHVQLQLLILLCCIPVTAFSQIWEPVEIPMTVTDIQSRGNDLVIVGFHSFAHSANGVDWDIIDLSEALDANPGNLMTLGFFDDENGITASRDLQGSDPRFITTHDGGATWEFLHPDLDSTCFSGFIPFKIHILNDSSALLQNLNSSLLMFTRNKGKNWTCTNDFSPESGVWLEISVISDAEWYIGDSNGHHKTEDGGISYSTLIEKNFAHIQIEESDVIYALSYKWDEPSNSPVFYKTSNDWISYDSIILTQFENEYIEMFTVTSDNEIYIYINGTETYFSNNGGLNFSLIQTLTNQPFRSAKIGNHRYLSGRGLWKLKSNSTGISNFPVVEESVLFPNPTNGHFYLTDKSIKTYSIYRNDGVLVRSGRVVDGEIDISNLTGGLYVLKTYNHSSMFISMVVKL